MGRRNQATELNEFTEDVYYDEPRVVNSNEISRDPIHSVFWYQDVAICRKLVAFKIDTGAETKVLPLNIVKPLNLCRSVRATRVRIISYGNFIWKPVGEIEVIATIGKESDHVNFLVVDRESIPLLCLTTALRFGLISRHPRITEILSINKINFDKEPMKCPKTKEQLIDWYPDLFEGEGCFPGQVTLEVDPKMKPVACPPSRFPLAIQERSQKMLNRLEQDQIISKNDTPTAKSWIKRLLLRENRTMN